jgi:hypothetical protein
MPNKHPAANLLRALIIRDRNIADGTLQKQLEDWGFLSADPTMLPLMRQDIPAAPAGFDPTNRMHRLSVRFLREQKVYEFFHPNDAMHQALEFLGVPDQRLTVEQILLSRIDLKIACKRVNEKKSWHLTEDALRLYQHYFWNVPALTFDEWGRFLFNRTSLYERFMGLLTAPPKLAFYHLRLDQQIESKKMIQRVQEIAYFALEEIDQKPGVSIDKVKSINLLGKIVIEAHAALSTSDMALKDTLKQFEQWRMEHPQLLPPGIQQLAPSGNFSNSGLDGKKGNGKLPN